MKRKFSISSLPDSYNYLVIINSQIKKWLNALTDTYYYISQMILVAPSLPTTLVERVLQSVMSVYLSVSTFAFEPTDLWSYFFTDCLSITSRSSTKTAKRRITQTTPHDSPGTLVFWCQRSPRNSTGVTPYGGAKCRWGGSKSATFEK